MEVCLFGGLAGCKYLNLTLLLQTIKSTIGVISVHFYEIKFAEQLAHTNRSLRFEVSHLPSLRPQQIGQMKCG